MNTALRKICLVVVCVLLVLVAGVGIGYRMIEPRSASQHRRIVNDARRLNAAIDQWALANNKKDGDTIDTNAAAVYLKEPWPFVDLLGNPWIIGMVGTNQIRVSSTTKEALAKWKINWGIY